VAFVVQKEERTRMKDAPAARKVQQCKTRKKKEEEEVAITHVESLEV
jgi:hypothetical protein